jgi:hypothetical protein
LVWLLCTQPDLSCARIALSLSVCSKTVRRYRDILAEQGWTWEDLSTLDAAGLDRRFNPSRYPVAAKTPIDWHRVETILRDPKSCLRDAWHDYQAHTRPPHLSYPTFCKKARPIFQRRFVGAIGPDALQGGDSGLHMWRTGRADGACVHSVDPAREAAVIPQRRGLDGRCGPTTLLKDWVAGGTPSGRIDASITGDASSSATRPRGTAKTKKAREGENLPGLR